MNNEINTSRIIGSCLEVNSDIIKMRFDSKFPIFITVIIEKYYRRKLVNIVKKMNKANIPLKKDNLSELFSYIFNNYPPYGSYKEIKYCMYINKDDISIVQGYVIFTESDSEIKANIKINNNDKSDKFELNLSVAGKDKVRTYNIFLEELSTDIKEISSIVNKLNIILISITMNYILDTINSYKIERKHNENKQYESI